MHGNDHQRSQISLYSLIKCKNMTIYHAMFDTERIKTLTKSADLSIGFNCEDRRLIDHTAFQTWSKSSNLGVPEWTNFNLLMGTMKWYLVKTLTMWCFELLNYSGFLKTKAEYKYFFQK